ncbi:MAG: c-type cytochrome [Verrucomicrobiales bacterium]
MMTGRKHAFILLFIPLWGTVAAIGTDTVQDRDTDAKVDLVEMGRDLSARLNCILCHSIEKGDDGGKVGPTWFGLIQKTPRQRKIIVAASDATRESVSREKSTTADEAYALASITSPASEIAIRESGPLKGTAYPPAMPPYPNLSDQQIAALVAYLGTLNEPEFAGPSRILVEREATPDNANEKFEIVVKDQARIQRVAMEDVSTRAISVGLPGGYNYLFDPSTFSVKKVWAGGFLNVASERTARGKGYNRISDTGHLLGFEECLLPLGQSGPIDQGYKDYLNNEADRMRRFVGEMRDPQVFSRKRSRDQAKFEGYTLSKTNAPTFLFSINGVQYKQRLEFENSSRLRFYFETKGASQPVRFRIKEHLLKGVACSAGDFADGVLSIPADQAGKFTITLDLDEAHIKQ